MLGTGKTTTFFLQCIVCWMLLLLVCIALDAVTATTTLLHVYSLQYKIITVMLLLGQWHVLVHMNFMLKVHKHEIFLNFF